MKSVFIKQNFLWQEKHSCCSNITCLLVCSVWLQVPALHSVLHGGGELYGEHAHASQGQRALQDLCHGQFHLQLISSGTQCSVALPHLPCYYFHHLRLIKLVTSCLCLAKCSGQRPISSATVWNWPTCWQSLTRDSPSIHSCWRVFWRKPMSLRSATSSVTWWGNETVES